MLALLTFNLSFKFRFTVALIDVIDWLPLYSKHYDRPMSVAEFMRESIVFCSTCRMSS